MAGMVTCGLDCGELSELIVPEAAGLAASGARVPLTGDTSRSREVPAVASAMPLRRARRQSHR
jgi:hypothetical protein